MENDAREEALAHLESVRYPNGDPAVNREFEFCRPYFSCDCGYEAMAYDEVEHECPLQVEEPKGYWSKIFFRATRMMRDDSKLTAEAAFWKARAEVDKDGAPCAT